MDALRADLAKFGNAWNMEVPMTLMKHYEPLQAEQNKKYASKFKVEQALKYGPHERNRIDVYSPADSTSDSSSRPVVVFIHGGGLVGGDNNSTPNIYANIGNYFTSNGFVTCLATYRLALQGGHHPNGQEDIAGALTWIRSNIASRGGDPSRVVAIGQSAGAYHLFSSLTTGYLDGEGTPLLRGAILMSTPFTVGLADTARAKVMMDWFQTDKAFEVNGRYGPAALFRREFLYGAREALPCELLLFVGEFEADEILDGTWEFVEDYKRRFGKLPVLEVLKGHNHVSYGFGLGLEAPEYERVGRRLVNAVHELTE